MKHLALALTALLVTACGGGGGGSATEITPVLTESVIVQQTLESCGLEETSQFQALFTQLAGIVAATSPAPTYTLTNVNQASATIDIDVDNDAITDFTGTFELRDSGGSPSLLGINLVTLAAVVNGGQLDALSSLLTTVPTGSQVVFGLTGAIVGATATSNITSNITFVLGASGTLGSTSGDFESTTGADCATNLVWTSLDISGITGPEFLPSGIINLTVQTTSDNVAGTITFDATSTAAVAVTRNGGAVQDYTYNLNNGTITAAP